MSEQPKKSSEQYILMIAVFLTVMVVMNIFFKPEEKPEEKKTDPKQSETTRDAGTSGDSNTPGTAGTTATDAEGSADAVEDMPVIPIPSIRIASDLYEAEFTTKGAALRSYRLKDYYRTAEDHTPANRLMLLEEMAPGKLSCVISSLDSGQERITIRGLEYSLVSAPESAVLDTDDTVEVPRNEENQLVFQARSGNWQIRKIYDFTLPEKYESKYGFLLRIELQNLSDSKQPISYDLVSAAGILPDDIDAGRFANLMALSGHESGDDEVTRTTGYLKTLKDESSIEHNNRLVTWFGLSNRFFTTLVLVDDPEITLATSFKKIDFETKYVMQRSPYPPAADPWMVTALDAHPQQGEAILTVAQSEVEAGQSIAHQFSFYGGPTSKAAPQFNKTLAPLLQYHWAFLQPISDFLLMILEMIDGVIGNYGLAIILLTVIVKSCLHPLTRKSLSSAHKMQKLQPLLKEIKEKYRDDKVKQQQETMALFKEHGVHPIGGCLPMLLQMPIFFALYGVFSGSFPIRQAMFIPGWIDDLSQPDRLFPLPFTVPYFEWNSFNLLPLIYLVLQFLHMSMQPKSADPAVQSQQKMMRLMPLFFVFIFYSMPSGLVLYFVIQTLFTLLEHWLIKRKFDHAPAGAQTAGAAAQAGAGAGAGAVAGAGVGAGAGAGKKKKKKKKKK